MSWEVRKLQELCSVITKGTTPSNIGQVFTQSGVKYIRSEMITSSKYVSGKFLYISDETHQKLKRSQLQAGDILFSMAGVYLGKTALLRQEDIPSNTNQAVALIRVDSSKCNNEFIYYYLNLPEVVQRINAIQSQSAQPNINLKQIGNLDIEIPEISVQEKVVKVLAVYDDLIENNRKQTKLLGEAAQRLYKEWFVDLRFPGYEHTKITDGVPEGWEQSTVAAVSSVLRRGISPRYNENGKSVVINQKCIRQTVVTFDESRKQEKLYPEDLNLQDSDTVICSTGAGTLGRVGQIFGNYPDTTLDSHVTLVRAKEGFGKQYLFQSLNSRQTYLMGMGKGSTNQLELNRGTIQDLDIYIPSKKVLNQFEQVAQPIHDKISVISKSILQLQTARNRLLPKLMSGEVKV